MKANRKFRSEEEAVSAVIGVILMVAITVAIAATVYYYVTVMMPAGETSTPTFQLSKDDTLDRLIVTQADAEADWNRLYLYLETAPGTSANIIFELNADTAIATPYVVGVGAADQVQVTSADPPPSQDLMSAGEYLDFAGDTAIEPEVVIVVVDGVSNQIIGSYTFIDLQASA